MLALQSLTLSAYTFACDKHLLGLSKLTALKCVELYDCRPNNEETRKTVLALEDSLRQNCPNVNMLFHSRHHDYYHILGDADTDDSSDVQSYSDEFGDNSDVSY